MLSILIPVYNCLVFKLIQDLHNQCLLQQIDFEIIVIDDCSSIEIQQQNKAIQTFSHTKYEELSENIGRSKIRNLLAQKANFPYLLFIDNDTEIIKSNFIQTYVSLCNDNIVISGGLLYPQTEPENKKKLRWNYGTKKEVVSASKRMKNPYKSFNSINFVISKKVFFNFDESICSYGHEDTLFGFRLQQAKIPILHIDNPILHKNNTSNENFLLQTKESIQTILSLKNNKTIPPEFLRQITLMKMYFFVEQLHLVKIIASIFTSYHKNLEKNIIKRSSLFLFNIYKISYLCFLSNNK
ncbi:MAG: glycosyltransferase [Bacteroidales bacterium]|nr:glycosyltransferase [Bacteroidales bacterium]